MIEKEPDAIADAPVEPDAPAVVADDTVADAAAAVHAENKGGALEAPAVTADAPAPDASAEVWICIRTADGRYPPPPIALVPVFQEWFTAQLKMAEDAARLERLATGQRKAPSENFRGRKISSDQAPAPQSGNGARHDEGSNGIAEA